MPQSLIDSHIHFSSHERLEELQRYRREIGAEKVCLLSLPVKPRINFNPEVLFAKARLGSKCYGLASFDYTPLFYGGGGVDLAGQVERFRKLGFDGLKVFLGKPSFQSQLGLRLDDPGVMAGFKRAENLQMPVLIHIADPLIFWSYRDIPGFIPPGWEQAVKGGGGSGGIPDYEELQRQAVAVLEACPDLTVIFPHLLSMGQDIPRLTELLDTHPRACLDLAPGLYFYHELDRQRDEAREFFTRFALRILFGTDAFWFPRWFTEFPYATVEDNLARARTLLRFLGTEEELDNPFVPSRSIRETVRGLGLDRDTVATMCNDSFQAVYPTEPRPLDPGACRAYLEEFRNGLGALGAGEKTLRTLERLRRDMNGLSQEPGR
jgi:predicted TIM-barrel fold metal-dependent hydrolase